MIHTCIIGGWTEPRGSRPFFGSLLLGVPDEQGELRYVGRVSSGFMDAQLGLIWKQLRALLTPRYSTQSVGQFKTSANFTSDN